MREQQQRELAAQHQQAQQQGNAWGAPVQQWNYTEASESTDSVRGEKSPPWQHFSWCFSFGKGDVQSLQRVSFLIPNVDG